MIIRPYRSNDKLECMNIFDSNCPKYFHHSERELFEHWLNHQGDNSITYSSPAYKNTSFDAYFVAINEQQEIVGCAGFYISADTPEARMAWGMVHLNHHRTGIGTALLQHRIKHIAQQWPELDITLGTSQHTCPYYEKMGFHLLQVFENGYGEGLHQHEMSLKLKHMFTIDQIQAAHSKVKSGADFPNYVKEIHALGVISYTAWVANGKTSYHGISNTQVESQEKYKPLSISSKLDVDTFKQQLKAHQAGQTDYMTFVAMCAQTGVEKWVIDIPKKTCTYFDQSNQELLTEQIPI